MTESNVALTGSPVTTVSGDAGQFHREVQDGTRSEVGDVLHCRLKIRNRHGNGIFAQRHGAELEFPIAIGFLVLHPIRVLCFQVHLGILNGTVLGIVHDTAHGAENFRECDRREKCTCACGKCQNNA